jgi:hypothetical protein
MYVPCVNASGEPEIQVTTPTPEAVSFLFGPSTQDTKSSSFRIYNRASDPNATLTGYIGEYDGNGIHIEPVSSFFEIPGGGDHYVERDLTITVYEKDPIKNERDNLCKIIINSNAGPEEVSVTVTIKYNAKIKVSRSSINFGEVPSKEHQKVSEPPVKISEEYGYKRLEGVTITPASGNENNWVTVGNYPSEISKERPVNVTFTLTPGPPDYERYDNKYTWKFIITSSNAEPVTITVEARIMRPPKLGTLYDAELEIKFDKPKGTVRTYDRYIDVPVRNLGDEPMHFNNSISKSPSGGITIRIDYSPEVVSKRGSENIKVHIIAPYDTLEGAYYGKLHIYAKDGDGKKVGDDDVDITIVLKWPVDFSISPPSVDFGPLELKELEYEKKQVIITLTELYLYKPVRNLRLSKSGESGNWLKEERDFGEIPPGESGNITIRIEPGLEAVPKDYQWLYAISASEIGAKRLEVRAKIVPLDITSMIESFRAYQRTPLYTRYPSSQSLLSKGIEMLELVERSEIDAEDWQKTTVLMKGTLSLLSSLNDGIILSDEENYGRAVESLMAASVSASTVQSNSNLNNGDISGFARDIAASADTTTREVLMDEAKMLELRGWTIKKAVEYAQAMNDTSGLQNEENVLESAVSYQYAAILYGLLDEKEKRLENVYEESMLMDKHDELVSDATDLRLKAENAVATSKENDLSRIWGLYILVNPYNYDTFSTRYKTAERFLEDASMKYKIAGELLLQDQTQEDLTNLKAERRLILFFFFSACILYGVLFVYVISRVIGGTMAYFKDMDEREVGDILVMQ